MNVCVGGYSDSTYFWRSWRCRSTRFHDLHVRWKLCTYIRLQVHIEVYGYRCKFNLLGGRSGLRVLVLSLALAGRERVAFLLPTAVRWSSRELGVKMNLGEIFALFGEKMAVRLLISFKEIYP